MSDQTEKSEGALPKGYDTNTPSREIVKRKKFDFRTLVRYTPTDQDQREKDLQEYEKQYLARYKQPKTKPMKLSNLKYGDDLGRLNLRKHTITKRKEYLANRKDYEQKYLARYKQPKSSAGKSKSWTQSDVNLGKISLQPYINAKRRAKQEEIREYEQQLLAR